jgi:hypothetical protein
MASYEWSETQYSSRERYTNCSKTARESLRDSEGLYARAMAVLHCIEAQGLNLAIFLWAISWNNVHLVKDATARCARTALMNSEELPEILKNWYRPPRKHGTGTRTQAAHETITSFALELTCSTLDEEMSALADIMSLPQEELSEEALLSIRWKALVSDVQETAPAMWKLFRHAAYTPLQDARNTIKNPDSVHSPFTLLHQKYAYSTRLSLPS